jgi:hypothetical protein
VRRGGPLKRKTRLTWAPTTEELDFYRALRQAVHDRAKGRCERCRVWLGMSGELAHVHHVQRGRNRRRPQTCSVCLTVLNVPENALWLCRLCHAKQEKEPWSCSRAT